MEEKVDPVKITDNESGKVYVLDFSRDSVVFMESRGFKRDDVIDYPVTKIPELFYYAFRKNHRDVPRNKTNAILESMRGLSPSLLERLLKLFNQAAMSNTFQEDEDLAKNPNVTVEM